MDTDVMMWCTQAHGALAAAFPDAKPGDEAHIDGARFFYNKLTSRWQFEGWLEGCAA